MIADRVAGRLDEFLTPELARWSAFEPSLRDPMAEIRRLVLSGGKRLRPAFCHWAFVGLGGDPDDPVVVDAGAAFELMHAFALFHDDVMDDAASRRGEPTTHTVFAERHRGRRLGGRVPAVRRGHRDPDRRSRVRLLRSAHAARQRHGVAGLERAADRAQHRPGARHARRGAGASRRRPRRAHLSLQVGQVHDRTAAPPRRGAGRARPIRRGGAARSATSGCRSATRSRCATT